MLGAMLVRIAPQATWKRRLRSWDFPSTTEPEEALLPSLTDRRKLSVDVGAAAGTYAALLVTMSRGVIAFEPVPSAAKGLLALFADTPIVRVENVALSDKSGRMQLRTPRDCAFRATLEMDNALRYSRDIDVADVPVRTLDGYKLGNVGFIKIDVEGHEGAVLSGAIDTIRRNRPNVLIEVEEQHRPGAIREVRQFFWQLGYRGSYLRDGRLESIESFDAATLQDIANLDSAGNRSGRGPYVNNFIFRPVS